MKVSFEEFDRMMFFGLLTVLKLSLLDNFMFSCNIFFLHPLSVLLKFTLFTISVNDIYGMVKDRKS